MFGVSSIWTEKNRRSGRDKAGRRIFAYRQVDDRTERTDADADPPDHRIAAIHVVKPPARPPSQPDRIAPTMFASPITEIAMAPRADVVVTPNEASMPDGSIAPHISVTKAGKWAVMKPSW